MQIARALVALLVVAAGTVGCSDSAGDDDPTTPNEPGEQPIPKGMSPACTGSSLQFCAGFKPASAVDFVGLRTESTEPRPVRDDGGAPGSGVEAAWTATLGEDRVGTPCASASDRAACEDRLAKLRVLGDSCQGVPIVPLDVASGAAAPQQSGSCRTTYLVITRGDTVEAITDAALALAFFGEIDSPQEALYLAYLSGESLQCGGSAPPLYVEKDGYDILTSTSLRCGKSTTRKMLHVSRSGQISTVNPTVAGETCESSR